MDDSNLSLKSVGVNLPELRSFLSTHRTLMVIKRSCYNNGSLARVKWIPLLSSRHLGIQERAAVFHVLLSQQSVMAQRLTNLGFTGRIE